MEYTGERVVKKRRENTVYYAFFEHFYRYCFARKYCRDKIVLDAGCGTGYGTYELSKSARRVVGVDVSKEAVDFCRDNYARPNIEFLEMDIRNIKFEQNYFDCVVSFEALEHIDEPEEFLKGVKRVLKPGGIFIVSTPDRDNYRKRFAFDDCNRFHKREFSLLEFEGLLSRYFCINRLCGQVAISGGRAGDSGAGSFGGESLFKNFVRRAVVKNNILYNLFVVLSLKKKRYAVRCLDEKREYVYLIAVCTKGVFG